MKRDFWIILLNFLQLVLTVKYDCNGCKPFFGELLNPFEWLGTDSGGCAYIGLGIRKECRMMKELNLHHYIVLIWQLDGNQLLSVAQLEMGKGAFPKEKHNYTGDPPEKRSRGSFVTTYSKYRGAYFISNGECTHSERFSDHKPRDAGRSVTKRVDQIGYYDRPGDAMVFLLVDKANTTDTQKKIYRDSHNSKFVQKNKIHLGDAWDFWIERVVDAQILLTNNTSFNQSGLVLKKLFPNTAFVPHVVPKDNVKKGRMAMTRCYDRKNFTDRYLMPLVVEQARKYEDACSNYSIPLWTESPHRDRQKLYKYCHGFNDYVELRIGDESLAEYLNRHVRKHSLVQFEDPEEVLKYKKRKLVDESSSHQQPEEVEESQLSSSVVDVVVEDMQIDVPNVDSISEQVRITTPSTPQEGGCSANTYISVILKEIMESQRDQRNEIKKLNDFTKSVLMKYQNHRTEEEAVRKLGFRIRGFREEDPENGFLKVCKVYFHGVSNIEKRCKRAYHAHHWYMDTFIDEKDILLSKIRSSIHTVGLPPPTMNCRPYDSTWNPEWDVKVSSPANIEEGDDEEEEDYETFDVEEEEDEEESDGDGNEDDEEDDEEAEEEPTTSRRSKRAVREPFTGYVPKVKDREIHLLSNKEFQNDEIKQLMKDLISPTVNENGSLRVAEYSRMTNPEGLCFAVHERSERGFKSLLQRLRRLRDSPKQSKRLKKVRVDVEASFNEFMFGKTEVDLTSKYASTVYCSLKHSISASNTQRIHILNSVNGYPVGSNHYSRKSFHKMAISISEELHLDLLNYIISSGEKFAVLIDGSNDKAQIAVASMQIRILVNYWPVTLHWELLCKDGDHGHDYMFAVLKSINDASHLLHRPNFTLLHTFASQWLSTTTDGATNMASKFWMFSAQFRHTYRSTNVTAPSNPLLPETWCFSHYLETIIKHMNQRDTTLRLANTLLSTIHTLFGTESFSTSRHFWRGVSKRFNGVEYSFPPVHHVRWVGSLTMLLKRLMEQYGVILHSIKQTLSQHIGKTEKRFDIGMQKRLFNLHFVLSDVRVYLRLNGLYNILRELSTGSKLLQQESLLMGDAEMIFNSTLHKLEHNLHEVMDSNLRASSGTSFLGFKCIEPSTQKLSFCHRDILKKIYSNVTAIGSNDHKFVIVVGPHLKGDRDFLSGLSELSKLRAPHEYDEDFFAHFYNDFNVTMSKIPRNVTLKSRNANDTKLQAALFKSFEDDQRAYLKDKLSFNESANVPLIRMYNAMDFEVYASFKNGILADLRASIDFQLKKTSLSELLYYSSSVDVIADIIVCSHSFHPANVTRLCKWTSMPDLLQSRGGPFYISGPPSNPIIDTVKRVSLIQKSLKFFSEHLQLPNLSIEYLNWMASFSRTLSSTDISTEEDEFLHIIHNRDIKRIRSLSGAHVIGTLLRHSALLQIPNDVHMMLKYSMIPSPTSASVERSFSLLNNFKDIKSTRMKIDMENARLRTITNGPSINLYDPHGATVRFLQSNVLPVTNDDRSNQITAIRDERHLPYDRRTVVLNPKGYNPPYISIDHNTHFIEHVDWYHRQKALTKLSKPAH
ncbi:unnamed protein product [Caenorhabditis brenneri]